MSRPSGTGCGSAQEIRGWFSLPSSRPLFSSDWCLTCNVESQLLHFDVDATKLMWKRRLAGCVNGCQWHSAASSIRPSIMLPASYFVPNLYWTHTHSARIKLRVSSQLKHACFRTEGRKLEYLGKTDADTRTCKPKIESLARSRTQDLLDIRRLATTM